MLLDVSFKDDEAVVDDEAVADDEAVDDEAVDDEEDLVKNEGKNFERNSFRALFVILNFPFVIMALLKTLIS